MEEKPERLALVRQSSGVSVPSDFPRKAVAFTVPANTKARLLVDQTYLTTAYPELIVTGGKGAAIEVGYAESLFVGGSKEKGESKRSRG
jgi:hypothetical protein